MFCRIEDLIYSQREYTTKIDVYDCGKLIKDVLILLLSGPAVTFNFREKLFELISKHQHTHSGSSSKYGNELIWSKIS